MPKPRRWIPWVTAGGGSAAWTRRPRGDGSIGSARIATATACCWRGRSLAACAGLFAAVVGGRAGYGTGALMPLVLVPLIGAEPVVPIIAISSIFTTLSRFAAYLRYADRRRALIVIAGAGLTTALGAYG